MIEILTDALLDAFLDTIKLLPFLFVTYLLMEYLERKTGDKSAAILSSIGKLAPVFGGLAGIVPQCGFSAAASSLYAGGLISVGTLLAVFLSTSDEMLPIFISEQVAVPTIAAILITKAVLGIVSGLGVDFLLRFTKYKHKTEKHIRDAYEDENESEEHGIFYEALQHSIRITIFIFLITLVLTILVEGLGKDTISGFLSGQPVFGVFLSALIGLIPNCAASVIITQLYLDGLLGSGQMIAGLLVGAGVGLLVLFRSNRRHMKENFLVTAMLYIIAVFWGLLIEALGIRF